MSQMPPPPPPGGYGAPPPPPGGGYGQQPGGFGQPGANWDVGAALSYGWAKFQANLAQVIIAALALVVGVGLFAVIGFTIQNAIVDYRTSFFVLLVLNALISALLFVVGQVIGAGLIRGALDITEGRPFEAATVFKFHNIGNVIVTSLIVGAGVAIGTILCYLPGLVVGFVTSYSLFFVIDRNMSPVEAIKASFELVKNNLGPTIIWYLVGGIVAFVGVLLCGIGALVTFPLVLIGTAYTYKTLTGAPVAP